MEEGKWCYSLNGEDFEGGCNTKEEAIEEAKDYIESVGESHKTIYLGRIQPVAISVNTEYLLDEVGDNVYAEVGDIASDYLTDVTDEDLDELDTKVNEVVRDWVMEHYPPNFSSVDNVVKYNIKGNN